jgi:Putative addiction module component
MNIPLERIEAELLALPHDIRAQLAELLLSSLEDEDEIAEAWDEEADRRYQELLAGEVEEIPADQALAQLRAQFRRDPPLEAP